MTQGATNLTAGNYIMEVELEAAVPSVFEVSNADSPYGQLALSNEVTSAKLNYRISVNNAGILTENIGGQMSL